MRVSTIITTAALVATVALALPATSFAAKLAPAPVWQSETLMGPARQAAELIKATFSYNAQTKKLVFKLEAKTVEMTLGSKTAKVGTKTITLPEAPKVVNGSTYVPLKNLLVGLGCEIKPGPAGSWIICVGEMCIRLEVPAKPA